MRIVSFNANGIRSAQQKGFFTWLEQAQVDVLCIQETKAQQAQLNHQFFPADWHVFFSDAIKKGYSGTAIYCHKKPDEVIHSLGAEFADMDAEGRYIEARFGRLSVASIYLPSGSSGEERQQIKFSCLNRLLPKLQDCLQQDRDFIFCGDWNIAHRQMDLKNWRGNQKNSGFLPEERAWFDQLLASGYVDAFRQVNPEPEQYTWWSNRGQAWAKNVGWRIDYQIVSPQLAAKIQQVAIHKEPRFSDHAPLIIDYDWSLY